MAYSGTLLGVLHTEREDLLSTAKDFSPQGEEFLHTTTVSYGVRIL